MGTRMAPLRWSRSFALFDASRPVAELLRKLAGVAEEYIVLVRYDRMCFYAYHPRELAAALEGTFWDDELGGYRITNERPDVSAAYSAWLTQSLLALHAADPDPRWLAWARANLDALEARLTDDAQPGYANLYYRCEDRKRPGCENGQAWTYDPTRYLVSQAWMQRAQALLAARLAGRG